MADIFLSYSRQDVARAERIKHALEGMGLTVFFDATGLHGGEAWSAVLDDELRKARVVVSAWTRNALKREWVLNECRVAKMRRVLVPVQIEPFSPLDVPTEFTGVQYLDLTAFEGDTSAGGWPDLVRTLARMLERPELAPKGDASRRGAAMILEKLKTRRATLTAVLGVSVAVAVVLLAQAMTGTADPPMNSPQDVAGDSTPGPAPVPTSDEVDDHDAWGMASSVHTRDAYKQYLEAFPDGLHNREARKLMFRLGMNELNAAKELSEPSGSGQAEAPAPVASSSGPPINTLGPLSWHDTGSLLPLLAPHLGRDLRIEDTSITASDAPFLPGYRFLEVSNARLPAPTRRFFLYSPDNVVWLNFTNAPIYQLTKSLPIRLNEDSVVQYVRFFFTYVRGKHGRFIVAENVDDVPWVEAPPATAREVVGKMVKPITVKSIGEDGSYVLDARMVWKDSLFQSEVTVKPNGLVSVGNETLLLEEMPVRDDAFGQ